LIPLQDKKFALVLIVPTNAPGVKFLCRTSYEMTSTVLSSPFDQPLSSRLDENDAVFIMDKVFVPWENLFVYVEQTVASGLIYLNSHVKDFANPEIRPYIDRYMRGSNGYSTVSSA
jgi:aromatic ring hydroxylase